MDVKTAIYRYCNYQERCHKEVRNKLYELGARTNEVQQLLTELIEAGLLNEERYARSFARGKFRIKQWGRNRIVQQLKMNQISDYCIKQALKEIDPVQYDETFQKVAEKRWEVLKTEKNVFSRKKKTYQYLILKGYETDLVQNIIQEFMTKE